MLSIDGLAGNSEDIAKIVKGTAAAILAALIIGMLYYPSPR